MEDSGSFDPRSNRGGVTKKPVNQMIDRLLYFLYCFLYCFLKKSDSKLDYFYTVLVENSRDI